MRRTALLGMTFMIACLLCVPAYATYSVVGVDLRTHEVGIAGAS